MQKYYLKIKDHWFFALVWVISSWAIWKILDKITVKLAQTEGHVAPIIIKLVAFKLTLPVIPIVSGVVALYALYKTYLSLKLTNSLIRIAEAKYYTDKKSIDITNELNNSIIKGRLKIVLSNNIAGDPDFGTQKKGKVKYIYGDKDYEKIYTEGDVIDIP